MTSDGKADDVGGIGESRSSVWRHGGAGSSMDKASATVVVGGARTDDAVSTGSVGADGPNC